MTFILTKRGTVPIVLDLAKVSWAFPSLYIDNSTEIHLANGIIGAISMPFGMFVAKLAEAGLLEKED